MLGGTEVLTTAQMRAIESAAISSGEVTGLQLMERAGRAVAGHIRLRWPRPGSVTVLCGPGNNGGDGYVVARHMHDVGWRVRVLGMDTALAGDAAEMRRRWQEIGDVCPLSYDYLRADPGSDVYVDAIFGIGLARPPVESCKSCWDTWVAVVATGRISASGSLRWIAPAAFVSTAAPFPGHRESQENSTFAPA